MYCTMHVRSIKALFGNEEKKSSPCTISVICLILGKENVVQFYNQCKSKEQASQWESAWKGHQDLLIFSPFELLHRNHTEG